MAVFRQTIRQHQVVSGDCNIYGLTPGNLTLSSGYPEAVESFYVKGYVRDSYGTYEENFEGYLLQNNNYSRIEVSVPEGEYHISIESVIEIAMLERSTTTEIWIRFMFNQPCDLPVGDFSTGSDEPFIEILSPSSYSEYTAGSRCYIYWNSEGVDELTLQWIRYNSYGDYIESRDIAYQISASTGRYMWEIPIDQVSGDYYRIVAYDASSSYGYRDESDYFSIIKEVKPDPIGSVALESAMVELEESHIVILGNSTRIIANETIDVSGSCNGMMHGETCDIVGFSVSSTEYGDINLLVVEITETDTGSGLLLTDVFGETIVVEPDEVEELEFGILYDVGSAPTRIERVNIVINSDDDAMG